MRKPTVSTTPVAGPTPTTSPTPSWSSTTMNRPLRMSLTMFCAPKPRPAPRAAVRRARELRIVLSTAFTMRDRTMITITTVVMLLSTLPSVRVRWTTRTAVSGEAWIDCVSSTFWRFFTPDTIWSTVLRITTSRIHRRRKPPIRKERTWIRTPHVEKNEPSPQHTMLRSIATRFRRG